MTIKCEYCNKEYDKTSDFEKDCFMTSDGLTWDLAHNCQKDKEHLEINGYK